MQFPPPMHFYSTTSSVTFIIPSLKETNVQVLIFLWFLALLVKIDYATFEVISTNYHQNITKKQFLTVTPYNKLHCANRFMKEKMFHVLFKENHVINKQRLYARKIKGVIMTSNLYYSKFFNVDIHYFDVKLTSFKLTRKKMIQSILQHERQTRATRVRNKQRKCDTSAIRVLHEQHDSSELCNDKSYIKKLYTRLQQQIPLHVPHSYAQ